MSMKSDINVGTDEDERTVLHRTKSLDGTKPNANPNTNPNPKLIHILTLFSCFTFFEHRTLLFSLALMSISETKLLIINNICTRNNYKYFPLSVETWTHLFQPPRSPEDAESDVFTVSYIQFKLQLTNPLCIFVTYLQHKHTCNCCNCVVCCCTKHRRQHDEVIK